MAQAHSLFIDPKKRVSAFFENLLHVPYSSIRIVIFYRNIHKDTSIIVMKASKANMWKYVA